MAWVEVTAGSQTAAEEAVGMAWVSEAVLAVAVEVRDAVADVEAVADVVLAAAACWVVEAVAD